MGNKVKEFLSDVFGEVRAFEREGELWFVAKDICDILGNKTKDVPKILNNKGIDKIPIQTNGGKQKMLVINKTALHILISSNRKLSLKERKELYYFLTKEGFSECVSKKCEEAEFLRKLEETMIPFGIELKKQWKVMNYYIDCYVPLLNVAIEYDENDHDGYTYEQHELRQRLIEKELGCRFIRVSNKNSDEYNVGVVIRDLFNIGSFNVLLK